MVSLLWFHLHAANIQYRKNLCQQNSLRRAAYVCMKLDLILGIVECIV